MITLAQLNTKFNTHAATAGAKRCTFGFLEDHAARPEARDMTDLYPTINVVPFENIKEGLEDRKDNDEVIVENVNVITFYQFNRDMFTTLDLSLAGRCAAWDSAKAIHVAFIEAVGGDSNIQVLNNNYNIELLPEGIVADNVIAVRTNDLELKLTCSV